jgi:membrane protein involved in colicin uptake
MEIPGIQTETVTAEELAAEATPSEAPQATKRTRTKKEADPAVAAAKAEAKAAKEAEKAAKKAEREAAKANKVPRTTAADKFIKVLVPAAESGLRPGSGRFQFLEAAATATKVGDIVGKEFTVGDKTVKLSGSNITGMFSRGHIALSNDGENWEKLEITRVAA